MRQSNSLLKCKKNLREARRENRPDYSAEAADEHSAAHKRNPDITADTT